MSGRAGLTAPGRHDLSPLWRWALLAGVVLYAGALRLWMFVGIARLDMLRYMELSNHVLSGGSLFDEQVFYASSRLPLMLPMLASNKLFGFGEHVSTAWPLACSVAAVAAVFFLGRELYDDRVGLLAAFGMASVPLEIEHATQLLPDPIEGLFIVLAVLFGVLAITRDRGWRWWAIASGAALALAYYSRVNAIVFLPGILAIGAIIDPARWKRSLWSLAGLAGALLAGAGVFWLLSGDPLVDWHRTSSFYSSYQKSGFEFRAERFWKQYTTQRALLWLPLTLVAGSVWALIKRSRQSWLLLAWAWGFWFYLDVVSPLHGLDTSYRYAEPIVAPALLLFAAAIWWLAFRLPRPVRWAPVAAAVLCFLVLLPFAHRLTDNWRDNSRWASLRRAAVVLNATDRSLPIYTDHQYHLWGLNYYSGFRFGRDTLEPLDAPVNRDARLFWTNEAKPPTDTPYLWVSVWNPPVKATTKVLADLPHPDGRLKVLLVTPEAK